MLALISPAKKLDFQTELSTRNHTQPDFLENSIELVTAARKLNRVELANSMKISEKLADLNYRRFRSFSTPFDLSNAKQAALVFNGDTYVGLKASTFSKADMKYAQKHLRILSGLYGLLRPLDLIQPYRLEMGAKFRAPGGTDLYGYWNEQLSSAINKITSTHKNGTIINLASNEYFKAANTKTLTQAVITPVFKEIKNGEARTIGLFAKRARGSMARFMLQNRIEDPKGLKKFSCDGYEFRDDLSNDSSWVFSRSQKI